jgi:hypothetical protein
MVRAAAIAAEPIASFPPGQPLARLAIPLWGSVLGWQPGDRLTVTAAAGVVIARRDPGGLVTMPAEPYLTIPADLRRRRRVNATYRGRRATGVVRFNRARC